MESAPGRLARGKSCDQTRRGSPCRSRESVALHRPCDGVPGPSLLVAPSGNQHTAYRWCRETDRPSRLLPVSVIQSGGERDRLNLRKPGFTTISALRSAFSSGTEEPASGISRRISAQHHAVANARELGFSLETLSATVHVGHVFFSTHCCAAWAIVSSSEASVRGVGMLVNRAREGKGLYDQLTLNLNGRDCSVYTIHSSFKIYPSRGSNNIGCIYLIVIYYGLAPYDSFSHSFTPSVVSTTT